MKRVKSHVLLGGVIACLMVCCVAWAAPQPQGRPQGLNTPDPKPVTYRLSEESNLVQGCFEPCMCPLWLSQPMRGTFKLTAQRSSRELDSYEVSQVNWIVPLNGQDTFILGSGTYQISKKAQPLHRLKLNLTIGEGDPQTFDSGWVAASDFPTIEAGINVNGLYCFDTLISILANPVAAEDIVAYELQPASAFQQGCFDPCMCPIMEQQSLTGTFTLTPILNWGTHHEYAVMDVNWKAGGHTLTGSGRYTVVDGFAGPMHQLELELEVDGFRHHFDSHLLNTDEALSSIDIVVTMNDMFCYDIVLEIHAKPVR